MQLDGLVDPYACVVFDDIVEHVGGRIENAITAYAKTPKSEGSKDKAPTYRSRNEILAYAANVMKIGQQPERDAAEAQQDMW